MSTTAPTASQRSRRPLVVVGAVLVAILLLVLVDRLFFADSTTPAGTGSGDAATQARTVPPFRAVELAGANNVAIEIGAPRSVVVHADRNLLGRVTTQVSSGTLLVGTTPGNLDARSPMFVVVRVPSLRELTLSGAGNLAVTGIRGPRLTVALPGSGNIHASGSVSRLDVTLSGAGTAMLGPLVARDAAVTLSGNGTVMLTATHRLAAELTGTGTVFYGGGPAHVTQHISGTGTISPG